MVPLLLTIFTGAGILVRSAFQRTRCTYLTFEAAHRELVDDSDSGAAATASGAILALKAGALNGIQVIPMEDGIVATGHCANAVERVRLPYLERARW